MGRLKAAMDDDTTDAAWAQTANEQQEFEEQELLRADPAFIEWLESLNSESTKEYERGYHCE